MTGNGRFTSDPSCTMGDTTTKRAQSVSRGTPEFSKIRRERPDSATGVVLRGILDLDRWIPLYQKNVGKRG